MARNKTQKSGDKKPKRFRRIRWIFKWIVMPIVILALAAGAFLLYQYNQYMDGNSPAPKPPTKQYMVEEKETWYDADMPATTQETGDEKGEEVKVDPNDWK